MINSNCGSILHCSLFPSKFSQFQKPFLEWETNEGAGYLPDGERITTTGLAILTRYWSDIDLVYHHMVTKNYVIDKGFNEIKYANLVSKSQLAYFNSCKN